MEQHTYRRLSSVTDSLLLFENYFESSAFLQIFQMRLCRHDPLTLLVPLIYLRYIIDHFNLFSKVVNKISETDHIAVVREAKQTFENDTYKDLVGQLAAWVDQTGPEVESVNIAHVKILFDKSWLTDEEDIDRYLTDIWGLFGRYSGPRGDISMLWARVCGVS